MNIATLIVRGADALINGIVNSKRQIDVCTLDSGGSRALISQGLKWLSEG